MTKYPNAFYRVSAKALVHNHKGHILVCKHDTNHWTLPGGGIDHGEEPASALVRELKEELGLTTKIEIGRLVAALPFFVAEYDRYQMWLVYETLFNESGIQITKNREVSAFSFMDPEKFKDSTLRSEQLVYRSATAY